MLALLVWLSNAYGHTFRPNTADVTIRTVPQDLEARLEAMPPPLASSAPSQQIVIKDSIGQVVDRVSWRAPVPTVHKREWWNLLLGNPAGYLPDDSPLERLDLEPSAATLPARRPRLVEAVVRAVLRRPAAGFARHQGRRSDRVSSAVDPRRWR